MLVHEISARGSHTYTISIHYLNIYLYIYVSYAISDNHYTLYDCSQIKVFFWIFQLLPVVYFSMFYVYISDGSYTLHMCLLGTYTEISLFQQLFRFCFFVFVFLVFSSPDPKVHVSYCYHWASVVRLSLAFCILINSSETTRPI